MTLLDIKKEYEYLDLYGCVTSSFEDYLHHNYIPCYDDGCNFTGYDYKDSSYVGVF